MINKSAMTQYKNPCYHPPLHLFPNYQVILPFNHNHSFVFLCSPMKNQNQNQFPFIMLFRAGADLCQSE
jgi:hypothetical protein